MFQQKASTRRTVRGSTDSDWWCCTVRFVVILIYYYYYPNEMKTTCAVQKREKREGSCSSCSNFFQKQEHFLPSGVARVLTTRFVCACLACPSTVETLALFRFDQQQQQHPASQILTGNGAPHATRVAWLYYAARPAPRAGRSYGRPCVDRKAKRLADSTSATAKKGPSPSVVLLPQPPIGMKKKKQAPRRRKEASATFQSEVKRSQSHTEVMYHLQCYSF